MIILAWHKDTSIGRYVRKQIMLIAFMFHPSYTVHTLWCPNSNVNTSATLQANKTSSRNEMSELFFLIYFKNVFMNVN